LILTVVIPESRMVREYLASAWNLMMSFIFTAAIQATVLFKKSWKEYRWELTQSVLSLALQCSRLNFKYVMSLSMLHLKDDTSRFVTFCIKQMLCISQSRILNRY